mgnify:FL=1
MKLIMENWNKWINEQEADVEIRVYPQSDIPAHIIKRLRAYFTSGYGYKYFVRWFRLNYRGGNVITSTQARNMYEYGCDSPPCQGGDRPGDYGLMKHIVNVLGKISLEQDQDGNFFELSRGSEKEPGGPAWSTSSPYDMAFGTIHLDGNLKKNPKKYERIITQLLLVAVDQSFSFSPFCQDVGERCPRSFSDVVSDQISNIPGDGGKDMLISKEIEEEPHRTLKSELSYLFVQNEKFAEAVYKGAAQWHQGISAEKIEDHAEEATKYLNLIRKTGHIKGSPWYAPQLRDALVRAKKNKRSDKEVIKVLGNLAKADLPDGSSGVA